MRNIRAGIVFLFLVAIISCGKSTTNSSTPLAPPTKDDQGNSSVLDSSWHNEALALDCYIDSGGTSTQINYIGAHKKDGSDFKYGFTQIVPLKGKDQLMLKVVFPDFNLNQKPIAKPELYVVQYSAIFYPDSANPSQHFATTESETGHFAKGMTSSMSWNNFGYKLTCQTVVAQ